MARESCNLDKDEAEILKASASSSSPSPSPPLPPPSPSSLYQKPPQELPAPVRPESSGNLAVAGSGAAISCEKTMSNKEPQRSGAAISCEKTMSNKEPQPPVGFINRCSSCRKRVGLTGFRCRCGDLFCAGHRYSDTHDCSFDYKAAGREQIAKANPLIRAAKIIKI